MSETEQSEQLPVHEGEVFDDPNRQAVGLDPAWVEGTGGQEGDPNPGVVEETPDQQTGEAGAGETATGGSDDFESWTKDDLVGYAQERGISPANQGMTKQELVDAIRAHEAGG